MIDIPRPPRIPPSARPLSVLERRELTAADLIHNRRLGWLLTLAREHGWVPAPDLPIDQLIATVREWLPDDFPASLTDDEVASYVFNDEDRDLALTLI